MNGEFTMSEYIAERGLGVSPHDPAATRMIRKHLKSLGYSARRCKRNGKWVIVWSDRDREKELTDLAEKLAQI